MQDGLSYRHQPNTPSPGATLEPGDAGWSDLSQQLLRRVQALCTLPGPHARGSTLATGWPGAALASAHRSSDLGRVRTVGLDPALCWCWDAPGLQLGVLPRGSCPCVLDGGPDVWEARQGMGGIQMLQKGALNSCRRECKELGKCSLIAVLGHAGWRLPSFLRSVSSTNTTISI